MRPLVNLIIFVFLAFLLACRPAAAPVTVGNKPISINDRPTSGSASQPLKPVAEMNWTGFEGNISKLKDFHGKAVILDFWATYCPPCIDEIPHLKELRKQYGDDLIVVGLHVGGDEDRPKIPEFVERLKIDYPLAYPEDNLTSYVFGQDNRIPQTAVFDRNGTLVKKIAGFNDDIRRELDQAVEQAMENK